MSGQPGRSGGKREGAGRPKEELKFKIGQTVTFELQMGGREVAKAVGTVISVKDGVSISMANGILKLK